MGFWSVVSDLGKSVAGGIKDKVDQANEAKKSMKVMIPLG